MLIDVAEGKGVSYFILPASNDYHSIPQDSLNPITKEKVELGKFYYMRRLLETYQKSKKLIVLPPL
ncbi:hypothetical protein ABW636_03390 [Aquimarina sp. 2201CG1-2-11]|uniref:hypothetical protein n=1 Tax=Aquimarina discodermiae TaxID=3231043 RepID=UPI0034634975